MKSLASIGNSIESLRKRQGLTQKEFGEMLGTTQSAVARIENGEQNLSLEMFSRITSALKHDVIKVSDGAINVEIFGGRKLSGEIITKTSKNGAMGLLAASLLNRGKTVFENVPRIEEVHRMIEVFQSIGVSVEWKNDNLEIRPPKKITGENVRKINRAAAEKTRGVIMLIGSLIHHLETFSLPQAGGCKLGARTVKPHLYAFENFGVEIKTTKNDYVVSVRELPAPQTKESPESPGDQREIILFESGDTVTENAIIAAAGMPGTTIIKYASANYMGQEVCFFLRRLGVKIEGVGTTTITVHGKPNIDQDVTYPLSEDPIESMFFIAVAAVTKSQIVIKRCPIDFLELELLHLAKMGFQYKLSPRYKAENGETNLVDIETLPSKLIAIEEKIEARPYPGLNIDNLPFFAVIATQARGTTFIHDWVYEKRAIHYKELDKLGGDTLLADPHRIYIKGPTKLKPAEVICPPALRPAAIILIGMLAAPGRSVLRNIYSINRGYEDIVKRLESIGARISIMHDL